MELLTADWILFNHDILLQVSVYLNKIGIITLAKMCKYLKLRPNNNNAHRCALMEHIARYILHNEMIHGERCALAYQHADKSWTAVYRHVLWWRAPLALKTLCRAKLSYIDDDRSRVRNVGGFSTAFCSQVLRGTHTMHSTTLRKRTKSSLNRASSNQSNTGITPD